MAYDPALKVQVVFDLGWNDAMSVILCPEAPEHAAGHRVSGRHAQDAGLVVGRTAIAPAQLGHAVPAARWRTRRLQDRQEREADHGGTRLDGRDRARAAGGNGHPMPLALRSANATSTRPKAARLVECLKRYRPAHPDQHRGGGLPLHDEWSHGADAFRYMAASAEQMTNEEWGGTLNYRKLGIA